MSWDWDKLKQQQQSRGGGGGTPPQMDEILEKFKKFKLPGGPLIILVIAIIMVAATTFYTVKQDEVGIVQRFGRYVHTIQPGLNFKLPIGHRKGHQGQCEANQNRRIRVFFGHNRTTGRALSPDAKISMSP